MERISKITKQTRFICLSVPPPVSLCVCPSVRMEKLDCRWRDFYQIWF
jgi:hypothetical protein